jgi:3-deoxy-manno-octulosonate cytidylyltransferase (CMP-KDO synthetase)
MIHNKYTICIIPARLNSTRLPNKMLLPILNKPLIQWTWEAACKVKIFDKIIIATDSNEIAQTVKLFGGNFILTSPECKSGTDRLVEIATKNLFTADIWVDWQGDEPFITESIIYTLLQSCHTDKENIWTLKKRIYKTEELYSPNTAKIVCDIYNNALYFSRSPIPYYRDQEINPLIQIYYKHVGIYAYTTEALKKIALLQESQLEQAEKLEQLRFLQHGFKIKTHEINQDVKGIDIPEDITLAENLIKIQKELTL